MTWWHKTKLLALAVLAFAQSAFAAPPCPGDCDDGGSVTVDELITGISIALGSSDVGQCRSMDTSGEGDVTVDEIVNALNNGLLGCPAFTGQYSGTVSLDAGRRATVELNAQANGQASGTATISEAAGFRGLFRGGGSSPISLTITGTFDLDSGIFALSGSFSDGTTTHSVNLSGVFPLQANGQGTLTFRLDSSDFIGTIARGNGALRTPTRTGALATPTATATAGTGSIVDPDFLGTWSGTARNEVTGVTKQVRIRIEQQGDDVIVSDLGGNLYKVAPASITMDAPTPTTLTYNSFGSPVIVFNLSLGANQIGGIYSATTPTNPPVIDAVGLVLTKEVPLAPDPRLAGTWSHNVNPLTPQEVRLRLEIQGDGVLVTDLIGDLFVHAPSSILAHPEGSPTALTYICDSGPCGNGNRIILLSMNLLANGRLVGTYREDAIGDTVSVGFGLSRE
jgi:hypothetical protein